MMFEQQSTLSDYFVDLVDTIGKLSFQLAPEKDVANEAALPSTSASIPRVLPVIPPSPHPIDGPASYKTHARRALDDFLDRWRNPHLLRYTDADTLLLPVIQMGFLGIRQDEEMMRLLLGMLQEDRSGGGTDEQERYTKDDSGIVWTRTHLTSGYFNFTEEFRDLTLATRHPVHIITAAPEV